MKTDIQVQQDVLAELQWEPSINAAHIGVEVKDGIVTLDGQVSSYAEKFHAEHVAQRVAGVKALTIEMEVTLPGPSKRNDVDIARTAENVLQWTTNHLGKDGVKVMVENGWITLSGEVGWEYQRQIAETGVRYLMGVKGVSNNITLKPKISSTIIKSDIEAAMKRRATAEAKNISVEVCGIDVTLTGKVQNWSERNLAMNAAWAAPGVGNVVDNMTIAY